jgi:hypothetical protein
MDVGLPSLGVNRVEESALLFSYFGGEGTVCVEVEDVLGRIVTEGLIETAN